MPTLNQHAINLPDRILEAFKTSFPDYSRGGSLQRIRLGITAFPWHIPKEPVEGWERLSYRGKLSVACSEGLGQHQVQKSLAAAVAGYFLHQV